MDSVIDGRQKALEAEKEKKLSNEQIITEIKGLGEKKGAFSCKRYDASKFWRTSDDYR